MLKLFLDLLYPRASECQVCGSPSTGAVCSVCMASMDYLQGITCIHCGKQLNEQYPHSICPDCKAGVFYYTRAYSCFEYNGMGKVLLHKLKYEGRIELAKVIGGLMSDRLKNEGLGIDIIIPVPIHKKKLEARGFNQSYEIAVELGRKLGKPVLDCMERKKETRAQYDLDRLQRQHNIVDAFSVRLSYNVGKYKSVLLLDDIYTTGSTVNECSKALKEAGAGDIYVITAATGSNT